MKYEEERSFSTEHSILKTLNAIQQNNKDFNETRNHKKTKSEREKRIKSYNIQVLNFNIGFKILML